MTHQPTCCDCTTITFSLNVNMVMFLFNPLYIYTLSFWDKQKTKHLEKQAKIRVSLHKAHYDLILLSAGFERE